MLTPKQKANKLLARLAQEGASDAIKDMAKQLLTITASAATTQGRLDIVNQVVERMEQIMHQADRAEQPYHSDVQTLGLVAYWKVSQLEKNLTNGKDEAIVELEAENAQKILNH